MVSSEFYYMSMGKQSSDLVPFLQNALCSDLYRNIKYKNKEENIFAVTFPRDTGSINTEWEKPLKDWVQFKKGVYEGYSKAKQRFLSALRRSVYLQFMSSSNSTYVYRFQTADESTAKREALKLKTKQNEDVIPSLPNATFDDASILDAQNTSLFDSPLNDSPKSEISEDLQNFGVPCMDTSSCDENDVSLFLNKVFDPNSESEAVTLYPESIQNCPSETVTLYLESIQSCPSEAVTLYPESIQSCPSEAITLYPESIQNCSRGEAIKNQNNFWFCSECYQVGEYFHLTCEPFKEFLPDPGVSPGVFFPLNVLEKIKNCILVEESCIGNYKVFLYKPKDI